MPFFFILKLVAAFQHDLKQPTKQCVTYDTVLLNCACFFAEDKSDRQKIKSKRII